MYKGEKMERLKIIVTGDYACFTRPEFKVEKMSYDVPTPGALEGLLKAIYWKPSMRYVIDKIVVFNEIKKTNIRKNEVKHKVSYSKMLKQLKAKIQDKSLYDPSILLSSDRTQRNSYLLQDVCYGIEFHIELTGICSEREGTNKQSIAKHYAILKKRLTKGSYFHIPSLGCAECIINDIQLIKEFDFSRIHPSLKNQTIDLGWMQHHVQFKDFGKPKNNEWKKSNFSDEADTVYYHPYLRNGVIDVEKYRSEIAI